MKTMRTVTVEQIRELPVKMQCDICKEDGHPDGIWPDGHRNRVTTTVELREVSVYPGTQIGEVTEYDICQHCFNDNLIPFLKSLGAEPRITDVTI